MQWASGGSAIMREGRGEGGGQPLRPLTPALPCRHPPLHLTLGPPPWYPLPMHPLHTLGRPGAGEAPPLGGPRAFGLAACGAGVHVGMGQGGALGLVRWQRRGEEGDRSTQCGACARQGFLEGPVGGAGVLRGRGGGGCTSRPL